MGIAELRTEFKQLSGLIAATDQECDKWINRGIRFLDLTANFPFDEGRQAQLIQAGDYMVDFLRTCRVVKSVWVVDNTDGRSRVQLFIDKNTFYKRHPLITDETQARPTECAFGTMVGVDASSVPGGLSDYDDFVETKAVGGNIADGNIAADGSVLGDYVVTGDTRRLIFAAPADQEYMLEIIGKFFSVTLTDAIPDNHWSLQYPDTVIAAALYKLNLLKYRNKEGASDYLLEVQSTLGLVDHDRAEEEANEVERMEG